MIVAGLFGFLIAPVFASVVRFFPPVVTGCIITVIGISLFPVALRWIRGNPTITTTAANGTRQTIENPNFGSATSLLLAVLTLIITLAIARFAPGFWSRMAVLLGLVIGTLIATVMGRVNWGAVGKGSVFEFPQPFFFGAPQFAIGVIISLCIVVLVIMAETTADLLAVGEIIGTDVDKKRIAAGLRADMGATAIAPVFNGFPISAFAQNVGMVALTGIKSRFVVAAGGGILVVLGLLPVLGRIMNAIPQPVLGGAGVVLFGSVAAAGIRTLSRVNFTNSNVLIVAASIGVGIIPITVPEVYNHVPELAGDDLRVRDQRDGDLRGAAEPRVQPLLDDRRAGGGRALRLRRPERAEVASAQQTYRNGFRCDGCTESHFRYIGTDRGQCPHDRHRRGHACSGRRRRRRRPHTLRARDRLRRPRRRAAHRRAPARRRRRHRRGPRRARRRRSRRGRPPRELGRAAGDRPHARGTRGRAARHRRRGDLRPRRRPRSMETALLVRRVRPDVRLVVRMGNSAVGRALAEAAGEDSVLDVAALAAPAVVEACRGARPRRMVLAGQTFLAADLIVDRPATLRELYGELAPIAVSRDGTATIVCAGSRHRRAAR